MTICFSREVANNLHKKGWGGRQMFLIFFKLFSTFFFMCFVEKKKKKSISISTTYSNLPQRWESHRKFLSVICYLDFCSMSLIYFGLICIFWKWIILTFIFQHSNHGLLPPQQAHTAPEQSCWAVKALRRVYTVIQYQVTHKWGLAHKQLSLTLLWGLTRMVGKEQTVETFYKPCLFFCSGFQS